MNPDFKAFQKNNDEIAAAQDITEILQAKQNLDNTLRSQEITRDTYFGLLKYINERVEYMDGEYDKTQLDPIAVQISDSATVGELTRIDHEADDIHMAAIQDIESIQQDITLDIVKKEFSEINGNPNKEKSFMLAWKEILPELVEKGIVPYATSQKMLDNYFNEDFYNQLRPTSKPLEEVVAEWKNYEKAIREKIPLTSAVPGDIGSIDGVR